jgi:hypothetical protein
MGGYVFGKPTTILCVRPWYLADRVIARGHDSGQAVCTEGEDTRTLRPDTGSPSGGIVRGRVNVDKMWTVQRFVNPLPTAECHRQAVGSIVKVGPLSSALTHF